MPDPPPPDALVQKLAGWLQHKPTCATAASGFPTCLCGREREAHPWGLTPNAKTCSGYRPDVTVCTCGLAEALAALQATTPQDEKNEADTRMDTMGIPIDSRTAATDCGDSMKYFAVWPGDPEATGPFYSRSGHMDIFTTRRAAEAFRRRWCADPEARLVRVRVTAESLQAVDAVAPVRPFKNCRCTGEPAGVDTAKAWYPTDWTDR